MGALYHLTQRLVDFCNVVTTNQNSDTTVPSSKVVYDGLNYVDQQKGTLASGDLNDCVTPGTYVISGSNTYTNMPSGIAFGVLHVFRGWHTTSFMVQEFHTGSNAIFTRFSSGSTSSWTNWRQQAGMPDLNNLIDAKMNGVCMKRLYKGSSTSDVFTSTVGGARHILAVIDSSPNRCAAWFVYTNGSNGVGYKTIVEGGSEVTVSTSSNTFTVNHSSGGPMYLDICIDASGKFLEIS